ncbi:MAG: AAA family ATPase [Oscillospiraceae bacterium]|nr:AAA family ATPase [Oscillospiraceae bacterium]
MEHQATVIALTGKGGVGKTSLSAAAVRLLAERFPAARILAIDADPAVGLATALGVTVRETLDDIRKRVAADVTGKLRDTQDILAEARFRLFEAMEERQSFAFLAIGRPEAAGCYCAVNAYLRQVISLLAQDFDYVVIDGEAGIEQINRRVMDRVTHLLFVSDQSKKGLQVIETIRQVADGLMMYEKGGLILNRVTRPDLLPTGQIAGMALLAAVGPDDRQAENDMEGRSVFSLPPDSPVLLGAEAALSKLGILKSR